ncbi:MAG: branched-chain amino acid aminotransferase [Bacteroidales bacterium]|nr:branched-chain amino acid aminotransferase [Bacteroidales bacterium]
MTTQNLDWANLGFAVRETHGVLVSHFKDGQWTAPERITGAMELSPYALALNYASSCFEGLKAFRGADGVVRIFRPDENARRLRRSAEFLDMPAPSEEMFVEMCAEYVRWNIDFLPPYGYNASMYLRPVLIGTDKQLNLKSPVEATFLVCGIPAGSYSGAQALTPVTAVISRDFDRAAPNGTGSYKLAANYAPSFHAYNVAHALGFQELLFLDPATKTKIDEFGSSNFFGIKGGTYVTPLSDSVLPSITNKSLQAVAQDFGLTVEKRVIPYEELETFEEVNACGTAVVITPIGSITDKPTLKGNEVTRVFHFGEEGVCGPVSSRLYKTLRGIQDGTVPDTHGWCYIVK